MYKERKIFQHQISEWVYTTYGTLCIILISFILFFSKKELHLLINRYHNSFFDFLFKYITYLGDGVMFAFFIVIFFFIKKTEALKYTVAGILTLVVCSITKRLIFMNSARPVEALGEESLYLIEGVKMAHWHSFPSGHTTTVFVIGTLLLARTKNKIIQVTIAFLVILAGFSRVYLSQHFFIDVLVGSFIGIGLALLSCKISFKLSRS